MINILSLFAAIFSTVIAVAIIAAPAQAASSERSCYGKTVPKVLATIYENEIGRWHTKLMREVQSDNEPGAVSPPEVVLDRTLADGVDPSGDVKCIARLYVDTNSVVDSEGKLAVDGRYTFSLNFRIKTNADGSTTVRYDTNVVRKQMNGLRKKMVEFYNEYD